MALSGSFTGSTANDAITPKIEWSAKLDKANAKATITAELYYKKSTAASLETNGTLKGTITIGSESESYSERIVLNPGDGYVKVATFTTTISYGENGKLSLTISATGAIATTTLSSTTISKKITLDDIERGLVYIDNGTSLDAYQVFIDNGSSWDQYIPFIDNGSGWDYYG